MKGTRESAAEREISHAAGGMRLLEEAFYLLRQIPLRDHALYYIGTAPFVLGLVVFWSDMSRSSTAEQDAAGDAFVLVLLYFWMKVWQALYCRKLLGALGPEGVPPPLTPGLFGRGVCAQVLIHATAVPALLLAGFLLVPTAWVLSFYGNASALAFRPEAAPKMLANTLGAAGRFAHRRIMENHTALLVGAVFVLLVWLNVQVLISLVPMALKWFTGIESPLTQNTTATLGNTTAQAIGYALTFLCVSPVFKALHTLRCFYGLAEHSGADLLSRLRAVQRTGGGKVAAMFVCLLGLGLAAPGAGQDIEAEPATRTEAITPEALDAAVQQVWERREFQWRYPKADAETGEVKEKGAILKALEDLGKTIGDAIDYVQDSIKDFWDDLTGGGNPSTVPTGSTPGWLKMFADAGPLGRALIYLSLAAAALGGGWWVIGKVRRRRGEAVAEADGGGGAASIDLQDDEIMASDLAEDGWLSMAADLEAGGDYRLAARAIFLAELARLAEHDLVKLQRSRSNRDYLGDVAMRARSEADLRAAFLGSVRRFERVWYGEHAAGASLLRELRDEYARLVPAGANREEAA